MKLIYQGGYNKYSQASTRRSFWYTYRQLATELVAAGKQVGLVTLAQADGHYNRFISEFPAGILIVDRLSRAVAWDSFDFLFLAGGDTEALFAGLAARGFSVQALKRDSVVVGESAGAYVLSSSFFTCAAGRERGEVVNFHDGFCPASKLITIAHADNPVYTTAQLVTKVRQFAAERGLEVLLLAENQELSTEL